MTNKRSILSLILAVCLIIPAMFMLTACDGKQISEKGRTYSVQNKEKDIVFQWGDDKDALLEEVGSEEDAKTAFSTFTLTFDENDNVTISFGGIRDSGRFYVINEDNNIEFYDTKEDAENKVNRVKDDYLGAEYKFSADRKTVTIKQQISTKTKIEIKLTVNAK